MMSMEIRLHVIKKSICNDEIIKIPMDHSKMEGEQCHLSFFPRLGVSPDLKSGEGSYKLFHF